MNTARLPFRAEHIGSSPVSAEQQTRKLELVIEVARSFWG